MVLDIIHLAIMLAMLACGLIVVWYVHKIHSSYISALVFFDAQDIDHRRNRADAVKARNAWHKEMSNALRDMRAMMGRLHSIAAEHSSSARNTPIVPSSIAPHSFPPSAPRIETARLQDERHRDSSAETQCKDTGFALAPMASAHRAVLPPASAAVLPSAPACIAAGLGPRPSPARTGAAAIGRQSIAEEQPAMGAPRFAATMPSMQAISYHGSAPPPRERSLDSEVGEPSRTETTVQR